MAGGSVTFTLDSGETLTLAYEDARRVYNTLWALSMERGAVAVAALLMRAWRQPFRRGPIELTQEQSELFRRALGPIRA